MITKWNYRVIAHKEEEDVHFQIHKVHYNEDSEPVAFTKEGVGVSADSAQGLKWVLCNMLDCLDKPIIAADFFDREI